MGDSITYLEPTIIVNPGRRPEKSRFHETIGLVHVGKI